ncbi:MAG: M23 family metallopeptidase [Carboxydocellales bacterium]
MLRHPLIIIMVLTMILAGILGGLMLATTMVTIMVLEDNFAGGLVWDLAEDWAGKIVWGGTPQVFGEFVFPLPVGSGYSYGDSWGAPREYGGNRSHVGIDIMARAGTTVLSVSQGIVERKGWDDLGGWRLGIRGDDGNYYYYAHNLTYATGIEVGTRVRQGQLISYVGSSGYGEIGTTGRFPPHLHFGIYDRGNHPFNPYQYLRRWEELQAIRSAS